MCRLNPRLHSGSDLEFFLIQPIQRLPRYVMLVAELIKHTPEGLEERAVLEELHKEVRGGFVLHDFPSCCACVCSTAHGCLYMNVLHARIRCRATEQHQHPIDVSTRTNI